MKFQSIQQLKTKPESPAAIAIHDFDQTQARFGRIVTRGCEGYDFDSFSKLTEIQVF